MYIADVSIRMSLTDSEVATAQSLDLTIDEYARRKVIMMSEGMLDHDHKTMVLYPTRMWNQFELKEISF